MLSPAPSMPAAEPFSTDPSAPEPMMAQGADPVDANAPSGTATADAGNKTPRKVEQDGASKVELAQGQLAAAPNAA